MITALGIVIYRKEEGFAVLSLKILVPYHAGDPGLIPGLEGSPGEGNGNALQYSCLENPMDRGAWQATVHGVARVGQDLVTKLPPLGDSEAQESLVCYSSWDRQKSDIT